MTDRELIARYASEKDQGAFAELVRRHLGWAYSYARRLVRDQSLAEDVVQAAFILLSRKAGALSSRSHVAGWLFRTTQYCAREAMRREAMRQKHEREAAMQRQSAAGADDVDWELVWPILDEAVGRLGRKDRDAVLLRFYQGMSMAELAAAEGIGEEAAKKRVQRAVEKLRGMLGKQGVTGTSAGLSAVLVGNVVQQVPARVVEGVVSAVAGGGNMVTAGIAQGAAKVMTLAKLKVAALLILTALLLAGLGVETARNTLAQERADVRSVLAAVQTQADSLPPFRMVIETSMSGSSAGTLAGLREPAFFDVDLRRDRERVDAVVVEHDGKETGRHVLSARRTIWDGREYQSRQTYDPGVTPSLVVGIGKAPSLRTHLLTAPENGPFLFGWFQDRAIQSHLVDPDVTVESSGQEAIQGSVCNVLKAKTSCGAFRVWVDIGGAFVRRAVIEQGVGDQRFEQKLPLQVASRSGEPLEVDRISTEIEITEAGQIGDRVVPIGGRRRETFYSHGRRIDTVVWQARRKSIEWSPDFSRIGAFAMDGIADGTPVTDFDVHSASYRWQNGKAVAAGQPETTETSDHGRKSQR